MLLLVKIMSRPEPFSMLVPVATCPTDSLKIKTSRGSEMEVSRSVSQLV